MSFVESKSPLNVRTGQSQGTQLPRTRLATPMGTNLRSSCNALSQFCSLVAMLRWKPGKAETWQIQPSGYPAQGWITSLHQLPILFRSLCFVRLFMDVCVPHTVMEFLQSPSSCPLFGQLSIKARLCKGKKPRRSMRRMLDLHIFSLILFIWVILNGVYHDMATHGIPLNGHFKPS